MTDQRPDIPEPETPNPDSTPQASDAAPIESKDEGQSSDDGRTPDSDRTLAREVETLRDQLLRKVAEFENYRRRTQEEQKLLVQTGMEILMKDLLPVLDDLDRSVQAARNHDDVAALQQGIEAIARKLLTTLEQRGLKRMEVVGTPFDVTYHEALMQMPAPDAEPGSVVTEVTPGYLSHDRVLRHARVIVAADPDAEAGA